MPIDLGAHEQPRGRSREDEEVQARSAARSEPAAATLDEGLPEPPATSGLARMVLLGLGLLFTALAAVGAFLPVLPTTPFLLVAAACFVRSSPSFHRRLLANRVFGPYLAQWQHDRTIPRAAKRKAYGLVALTFAVSIALVDATWLRGLLAGLGIGLLLLLVWLPTTRREPESRQPAR